MYLGTEMAYFFYLQKWDVTEFMVGWLNM